MSQQLYTWLRMDETTRLLAHGSDKKAQVVTQSELSALLTENRIPPITVVQRKMGINPDGKSKAINPWNDNFIAIKPAGVIGEIQPAIEDSELIEEDNVDYINAEAMVFAFPSGAPVPPPGRWPVNTPRAQPVLSPLSPRLGRLFAAKSAA